MSLTKTFALGMMAAYANARSLQDSTGAVHAWSNVMDYMGDLESTVAQLVLDMTQAQESLTAHKGTLNDHEQRLDYQENGLESLNSDLQDLDGRVSDNEISVMDLFGSQVTHDYFKTNAGKITVPADKEYTMHHWTVKAGETLDFAAHISTDDYDKNYAYGLRLRLYQEADGEREKQMALSQVIDKSEGKQSSDLNMLYRAKVEKDTKFSLRVDSFGQQQEILQNRAQFGYKTYGPNYEVDGPASQLVFYKGQNCDGEEWIVSDIDSLDYETSIIITEWTDPSGWNDSISSMIIPENVQVELWQDVYYQGMSRQFEGKPESVCQQLGDMTMKSSTAKITNYNVDPQ